MFFLIPLGIAAVSAISASTVAGGVAATAVAVGVKKIADRVEEDNIRAVQQARKNSSELVKTYCEKVTSDKIAYKAQKANELRKQISSSGMNKTDKDACLAQLNKMLVAK